MAAAKILVVDDRRDNILFLANDILRPEGYEVITALDGEKGLQKAREEKPDLIITDIRMPKMTGNELLLALRESGQDTPVILTTFHGSERTAIQAFRAGATDYLIKPFTVEEMMQAVKRALSLHPKPAAPPPQMEPQDQPQEPTAQKLLERRLVELSTLHDIGKAVTALLDLEEVFSRIVEAAIYLASAEEGYLMLVDPPSGELYLRAGWSYGQKHAQGFRLKVDDSLTGQVVSTGKPIVLKPPPTGDAGHKLKTGHLTKSMLAVPIKRVNKVIGVLSVDNIVKRTEFTEDDTLQLSILAEYAAIAIENARLYKQAQERAEALARNLEERPAGTLNRQDRAEAEPEETPTRPGPTKADVAGWHTEATGLADRLRTLAEEAEKLAQRFQPASLSTGEAKDKAEKR